MSERDMTTGAPLVRTAAAGDLDGVERLLAASGLPLDGVREALSGFVVAMCGDQLVGVAGLESYGDDALLRSVAVDAGWRSHGVGRALVSRLVSDAESRGVRALYLLTTTADGWFPAFGFHTIARDAVAPAVRESVEFRSACPASATVMVRERSIARDRPRPPAGGDPA